MRCEYNGTIRDIKHEVSLLQETQRKIVTLDKIIKTQSHLLKALSRGFSENLDIFWEDDFFTYTHASPKSTVWVDTMIGEIGLFPAYIEPVHSTPLAFDILSNHKTKSIYGDVGTPLGSIIKFYDSDDPVVLEFHTKVSAEFNVLRLEMSTEGFCEIRIFCDGQQIGDTKYSPKCQWKFSPHVSGNIRIRITKGSTPITVYNVLFLKGIYRADGFYESRPFNIEGANRFVLDSRYKRPEDSDLEYTLWVNGIPPQTIKPNEPFFIDIPRIHQRIYDYDHKINPYVYGLAHLDPEPDLKSVELRVGFNQFKWDTILDRKTHTGDFIDQQQTIALEHGDYLGTYSFGTLLLRDLERDVPQKPWNVTGDLYDFRGSVVGGNISNINFTDTSDEPEKVLKWYMFRKTHDLMGLLEPFGRDLFGKNGHIIYIADRPLISNISRDNLEWGAGLEGFVSGKQVYIDDRVFICRLMTGVPGVPDDDDYPGPYRNEWDNLMVPLFRKEFPSWSTDSIYLDGDDEGGYAITQEAIPRPPDFYLEQIPYALRGGSSYEDFHTRSDIPIEKQVWWPVLVPMDYTEGSITLPHGTYLGKEKIGTLYIDGTPEQITPDDIPEVSVDDITLGDAIPGKELTWLKFHKKHTLSLPSSPQYRGRSGDTIYVLNQDLIRNVSLEFSDYLTGKEITIDDIRYSCRILTGGLDPAPDTADSGPAQPILNEWDQLLIEAKRRGVELYSSTDRYSWVMEHNPDTSERVVRGGEYFDRVKRVPVSDTQIDGKDIAFRPVLVPFHQLPVIDWKDSDRSKKTIDRVSIPDIVNNKVGPYKLEGYRTIQDNGFFVPTKREFWNRLSSFVSLPNPTTVKWGLSTELGNDIFAIVNRRVIFPVDRHFHFNLIKGMNEIEIFIRFSSDTGFHIRLSNLLSPFYGNRNSLTKLEPGYLMNQHKTGFAVDEHNNLITNYPLYRLGAGKPVFECSYLRYEDTKDLTARLRVQLEKGNSTLPPSVQHLKLKKARGDSVD